MADAATAEAQAATGTKKTSDVLQQADVVPQQEDVVPQQEGVPQYEGVPQHEGATLTGEGFLAQLMTHMANRPKSSLSQRTPPAAEPEEDDLNSLRTEIQRLQQYLEATTRGTKR